MVAVVHGHGHGRRNHLYHGGNNNGYHQKKEKSGHTYHSKITGSSCFRCDIKGHWACTCRTPEYLVKPDQSFSKAKRKNAKSNLAYQTDDVEG